MRETNSSSTSDDSSRDSTDTSGAIQTGISDDCSSLVPVAVLKGVAETLASFVAAGEDLWGEAVGCAALEELGFSLTTVGCWLAGWPSFWARALRMQAMYLFFSSGVFFLHLTFFLSTKTTSVWTGLFRSGVVSHSSSASGSSSVSVSRDVDFPLPAVPTIVTFVMSRSVIPCFISSS